MKWNHLPEQGGLYDQNPDILDRFYYIFVQKSHEEARKQNEANRGKAGSGRNMRSAGRY